MNMLITNCKITLAIFTIMMCVGWTATSYSQAVLSVEPVELTEADTSDAPVKTSRIGVVVHAIGVSTTGELQDSASTDGVALRRSFGSPQGSQLSRGGGGVTLGGRYFLDKKESVALYAGFGGANNYLSEQLQFRTLGFKWTSNTSMFFLEVGPQIHLGSGPVVPYIYGGVGFANYSTTTTTVKFGGEKISSETRADFNLTLFGGAGCRIRVYKGIYFDLCVTYQDNGTMTHLIRETTSEVNVVRIQVGVSL